MDKGSSGVPLVGVAVIGCGLIGRRRAEIVQKSTDYKLVVVSDVDKSRAVTLAKEMDCAAERDWTKAILRNDVGIVIVSVTNNWLAPITIAAIELGKHVLVEKPMACNPVEAEAIVRAAAKRKQVDAVVLGELRPPMVKVGFNHRHHPALSEAYRLARDGAIGEILYVRSRYGHGGRPGYDREWRADRKTAGGGELLDQGIHVIDLSRWFLGDFKEAVGFVSNFVWNTGSTGVEDNGFALFRTNTGQIASVHASWTQWKNLFSFEVFGQEGFLIVEGLGGSYGTELLKIGRRRMEGGAPEERVIEFAGTDVSWEAEWIDFTTAIQNGNSVSADSHDGLQAIRMVHAIYEANRTGQMIRL